MKKNYKFFKAPTMANLWHTKKNPTIAFHVATWPIAAQLLVMVLFKQPNLGQCSRKRL
jgi:hypothetical protein